jgi:hypothetical protein
MMIKGPIQKVAYMHIGSFLHFCIAGPSEYSFIALQSLLTFLFFYVVLKQLIEKNRTGTGM